jgi:hypothetical protein
MTERPRPFSHVADLLRRAAKQRDEEDDEPSQADGEDQDEPDEERLPRKKKQKATPAKDEKEEDEPAESGLTLTPAQATALAQQICLAGAQRRGEVVIENPPPIVSEAACYAGTSTYVTPVKDPAAMAAAIIAAGRKARSPT